MIFYFQDVVFYDYQQVVFYDNHKIDKANEEA